MKIDEMYHHNNIINDSGTADAGKKVDERKKPADELEKTGQQGTKVDLSHKSVEFSKATEAMDKVSAEREEKIIALKEKIDNGTYHVDSTEIADKILEDGLTELV